MKRREFLSEGWRALNVGSFIALGGFVGALGITSQLSGHPSSIFCYECRACATECPFKFDPAGFVIAARINNPNIYMLVQIDVDEYEQVTGRKITLQSLYEMDPHIQVKVKEYSEPRLVMEVINDSVTLEGTYKMRAKDAAQFCTLCRNCTKNCPVDIEVTNYMLDLKLNSRFGI